MRCPRCDAFIRLEVKIDVEEMVDYVWTMLTAEGIAAKQDAVEAAVDYSLEYLKDACFLNEGVAESDSV